MNLGAGLITVAAIWFSGALITAALQFVLVRFWDRRDGTPHKNPIITAVAIFAINVFLWPFVFQSVWIWYGPRLAVMLRLRPRWTVEASTERAVRDWRLRDGTGFQGEAICYESGEPAHIRVSCDHDVVDYRLRMIAPRHDSATDWVAMERPSKEEWNEETREYRKRGEYYDETPVFGVSPQLEPGKYEVEFRVRLPSGETEELSGVTFVVT